MARRRPLRLDDSDNLIEMSLDDMLDVRKRIISLYGANPSVSLSVVPSGGNLPGAPLYDRRTISTGAVLAGDPLKPLSTIDVAYIRITQTIDSAGVTPTSPDTNLRGFPVYLNDSDHIQAMTDSDFYDTFMDSAIDTLTLTGWADSTQAGTYVVSTTQFVEDAELVSTTPIFINTIADVEQFSSGPLPEDSDQPLELTSYYLHRINPNRAPSFNCIVIDDSDHLQELTDSDFDECLSKSIRYSAARRPLNQIRYSFDSGNIRTTAILDTVIDSTGGAVLDYEGGTYESEIDYEYSQYDSALPYIIREDGTYRQIVPSGKEAIYRRYYLKIQKV